MPTDFQRPTITELIDRVAGDLEANVSGITARLRRTFEYGLTRAVSGAAHLMHGHISWVAEQIFPDTAVERILLRWVDLFGLARNAAVQSKLTLTVTGTGGTIPAGREFYRKADGRLYTADVEVASINPTASVAITAVDGGAKGDTAVGQEIELVTPIATIDSVATVASIDTNGVDLESLTALLARLLTRIQNPPMGGAPGDHVTWMKEVSGVTRAWEFTSRDDATIEYGKVTCYFVRDNDSGSIVPDAGEIATVQAYLDARSPFLVTVLAPTLVNYDFTSKLAPNTAAVQAAAEAEVQAVILADAAPGGTILWSHVSNAIGAATGETDHDLTVPAADKTHTTGQLPVYGTPTWQSF